MTTATRTPVLEHAIGRTGRLEVRLQSADVRLRAVAGDTVRIYTEDGRSLPDGISVDRRADGLTIRQRDRFGLVFGIGRRTIHLDIEVPAAAGIAIDVASGQVEVHGPTGTQAYHAVSGDLSLEGVSGTIEAAAVSGAVDIAVEGTASLAIKSVSGDVHVDGGRLAGLRVTTTSGDLVVTSELDPAGRHEIQTLSGDASLVATGGLTVEARTVSGDLRSDLPHRSDGRAGRRSLVVGDGAVAVEFRSVSGDLRVRAVADDKARPTDAARPTDIAPTDPPAPPSTATRPTTATAPDARPTDEPDDATEAARLAVLRALEAGEIDVAEAGSRLAELEGDDA